MWSEPDQDDLIWYFADRQSDGTYKVHVDIANHHNNRSTYNVHVYVMDNNGVQTFVAMTSQQVSEMKDELIAEDKSGKETTYQLTLKITKQQKQQALILQCGVNETIRMIWYGMKEKNIFKYMECRGFDQES